jgi:methionine synthase II (cobalamin-independent)
MNSSFQGKGLPLLIGSLPLTDHAQAAELVWQHTPEIPLWIQLPKLSGENITSQFAFGLAGLQESEGRLFIDTSAGDFEDNLIRFYEDVLSLQGPDSDLDHTRFAMSPDSARGFFELIERVPMRTPVPLALKGQIVGPVTFGTSVCDQHGKAIFYEPQLRDAAVKLLALGARWQVRRLSALIRPVLLFIDDPGLTGFGSSMHIGLAREDITRSLGEIIDAIHSEGGLAGVHVCANTDWTLILDSAADIVSFDAYTFFEQFIIYREAIRRFLQRGGLIAWGLIPTLSPEDIDRETAGNIFKGWSAKAAQVTALGIDREELIAQSLITPACGMGALSIPLALKALAMTRELSDRIRNEHRA